MEKYFRKKIIDKMFEAGMKERLSQLARKYDPELLFEIWTRIIKTGGVRVCLGKEGYDPNMTIEQALDGLDEFCIQIESLLPKPNEEDKGKKKKTG